MLALSRTYSGPLLGMLFGTYSETHSGTFLKEVDSNVYVLFEFCRIWRSITVIMSYVICGPPIK